MAGTLWHFAELMIAHAMHKLPNPRPASHYMLRCPRPVAASIAQPTAEEVFTHSWAREQHLVDVPEYLVAMHHTR